MTQKQQAIYDARALGGGKMLTLGLQHMFAMFGATVLVPVITGLSMSATLLFAGLGTLLFHLLTKMRVPAFLGSSFAFLGGYAAVVAMGEAHGLSVAQSLPYACIGVFCAGLFYFVLAGLFAAFGAKKVMRFFPPIVTGPIIIAIGLTLSGSAIDNCSKNWWIAMLAILIIIVCNIWGRKMIKIIPILLGVLGSYIVAACCGLCDFTAVKEAAWIGVPFHWENTAFHVFQNPNWGLVVSAIIAILPISLATMIEHIGDMCAISSTVGRTVDFICGGGDVFFEGTKLVMTRNGGYITASQNPDTWGYVFNNAIIEVSNSGFNKTFYLGRSWGRAKVVWLNTIMRAEPKAEGWGPDMNSAPVIFGEYNSKNGNGGAINTSQRKTYFNGGKDASTATTLKTVWNANDAAKYTLKNVLGGSDNWEPNKLTAQVSAPKISQEGANIIWNDDDNAICWAVFVNGKYHSNTPQIPLISEVLPQVPKLRSVPQIPWAVSAQAPTKSPSSKQMSPTTT